MSSSYKKLYNKHYKLSYKIRGLEKELFGYQNLRETYKMNNPLNIYNEPLVACGDAETDNGSWDSEGMCSERGGGVHQICVRNIGTNTNKFSKNTGQDDWSTGRGNKNHCVCLGAWSLYNHKKNKGKIKDTNTKKLMCEAIPNYSLSSDYVLKFDGDFKQGWEIWNGNEKANQIVDGVNSMVSECYDSGNTKQKEELRNNYCNFAKDISKLNEKNFYKNMCL